MGAFKRGAQGVSAFAASRAAMFAMTVVGAIAALAALVWGSLGWPLLRHLPVTALDGPTSSLSPVVIPALLIEGLMGWTSARAIRCLRHGTGRRFDAWIAMVLSALVFVGVAAFVAVGFYFRWHQTVYIFGR